MTFIERPTLRITGSKEQSDEERGAPLFAVRVHAIVGLLLPRPSAQELHPYHPSQLDTSKNNAKPAMRLKADQRLSSALSCASRSMSSTAASM
jgi:hypothetical protein